ncbi:CBM_collapsed_G0016520.mRNA.1.CDS.1 [Saccharomyces cerevisiae]|nr:CBM_collapsed_G0016520.mRNA.1.CDS.1 [Saccharomyces cerevisiae]
MSDIYMSNRLSKVFTLIAASIGREYCQIADALQAKKPLKNRWRKWACPTVGFKGLDPKGCMIRPTYFSI